MCWIYPVPLSSSAVNSFLCCISMIRILRWELQKNRWLNKYTRKSARCALDTWKDWKLKKTININERVRTSDGMSQHREWRKLIFKESWGGAWTDGHRGQGWGVKDKWYNISTRALGRTWVSVTKKQDTLKTAVLSNVTVHKQNLHF